MPYLFRNKMICGYCGKPITAESGTSHNKSVIRYYKCSGKKRKLNSCNKSVMRKDILENTVINATLQLLNGSDIIDVIADKIVKARNKRETDQSILNLLKEEKRATEQSLNNIIAAIEKGITSKSTQRRLDELEAKMQKLEEQIALEECREIRVITKDDITKYLKFAIKKEPKTMIDLLIRQIVLYDDRIEIYYNYTDKTSPDDGSRDSVFEYGSTRVPLLPPVSAKFE